jgi:hypothetical protein
MLDLPMRARIKSGPDRKAGAGRQGAHKAGFLPPRAKLRTFPAAIGIYLTRHTD